MTDRLQPYRFVQFDDPDYALGRIVNLLRSVKPFSSYPFGRLANVLMGQIRRGHYIVATRDGVPVGYVGWAMCDEAVARKWVAGGTVPSFEQCVGGDCFVGITFYAADKETCFAQARFLRSRYPAGTRVFGIREYGTRQRRTELVHRTGAAAPEATTACA